MSQTTDIVAEFKNTLECAKEFDKNDKLKAYREKFFFPAT